jgi:hypothetical protein
MTTKQKVSANGTYVFDPAEIDQLDELSMTTVLSDAINAAARRLEPQPPDLVGSARVGDTTINELLGGQLEPNDAPPPHSGFPARSEPAEETGDLIDPDLLFPDLPSKRR